MMRLLRRLLSAAREMVRDRAKVMADKTERDLDKRSPARGRAPPVHENMVKPLEMIAAGVDL